jgi:hypothetical protein
MTAHEVRSTVQVNTISIPEFKYESFEERIEKLNRKAIKLNITPIEYTITSEEEKEYKEDNRKFTIKFYNISITTQELKYGNYVFLGTIDRTQENGIFVNSVPGRKIPEHYHNSLNYCDHCHTNRYRTETFIFEDNTGTKQVGRTCLKEFFGIDPLKEIELLQSIYSLSKEYNEDNIDGYSRYDQYFDHTTILSIGLAVSKDFGYVTKKMAEDSDKTQTKHEVISILFPANHPIPQAFSKKYLELSNNYIEKANEIIEWATSHFITNSEFDHNIRNILNSSSVSMKYFGYLLCLIPLYHKAMTENENKKEIKNEYYGNEKEKIQMELECKSVYQMESYYGFTTIISFLNNDGYQFVWYASGTHTEFERGMKYNIKATIKGHKEYKGMKQTVITRAKII